MKLFFVKYLPVAGTITGSGQSYFNNNGELCHVTTMAQLKNQHDPTKAMLHLCTTNIKKGDVVYDVRNVANNHQPYNVIQVHGSGKIEVNPVGTSEVTYIARQHVFKTVTVLENHSWLKDGQEFDYGQADVFIKHQDYADFMIPYHPETEFYLNKPGYYVFVYFSTLTKPKV